MADEKKPAQGPPKKPLFAPDPKPAAPASAGADSPVAPGVPASAGADPSVAPPAGTAATPAVPTPDDLLALTPLFAGGGEPWLPLLKPLIERRPNAASFIGPGRPKSVVPVRELTFQALKPNPPERWKVVIFGQNPYPRIESATGIAMFDNTFGNWGDSAFGRVVSIRCIIKAAAMWKHKIPKATKIDEIRKLLAREKVVPPPEWFQAMLTQGVLLLNASLTASSDGSTSTEEHTMFWRPVVEGVVRQILEAKKRRTDGDPRGVVFAWWGTHARALRAMVEGLEVNYPSVHVRHVDHCNPAAQGDIFCDGDHFGKINAALDALRLPPVDWLPAAGWQGAASPGAASDSGEAGRMGQFITHTMELHKLFLERLQGAADEKLEELPAIDGLLKLPLLPLSDAAKPVVSLFPQLDAFVRRSLTFAEQKGAEARGGLSADEAAALYLYTTESPLYRQLNAALRHPDRAQATPYFGYLRLFLAALSKLEGRRESLYRGVKGDFRRQYARGNTVTWWGVSSCTVKPSVARAFLGGGGRRMLFEIVPSFAVGIRSFSAFTGEEEYLLPPGVRLQVVGVAHEAGGLSTVKLRELEGGRLVA
jgi:uracil DNA glycosylase